MQQRLLYLGHVYAFLNLLVRFGWHMDAFFVSVLLSPLIVERGPSFLGRTQREKNMSASRRSAQYVHRDKKNRSA